MRTVAIDLTDLDVFAAGRYHGMFAWLRANDPVHWQAAADGAGFWSLTRYDDLVAAYREHGVFSSCGGPMLGGSFRSDRDTAVGRMLVASDPPQHRMLRQVVHRAFAPDILGRASEQIAAAVDRALDRALADGGCDFAVAVAPELPVAALGGLLGLSRGDAYQLLTMTHRMIGFLDPALAGRGAAGREDAQGNDRLRLAGIQADIFEFFADMIAERRGDPGPGLLGALLRARVNGRPMGEEEVIFNCLNVTVGGNETTANTACAGLIALMENEGAYDLLLSAGSAPGLLDSALNEILRWSSTNAYTHRIAKRDVQVSGKQIWAGQSVALWNVSANFDEDQFPDPGRFDLTRAPNRHLAFGSGIHRCVGAQLSLSELAHLFQALTERHLRFELAGDVKRLRSNFMLGITQLPVRVMSASEEP